MFVPRSLRLKGVKEPPKKEPEQRGEASTSSNANVETPNVATQINSTFLQPGDQTKGPENTTKGPKFTIPLATPEYLAQLAAGVELIFTDYAHQHPEHANWLRERYRTVEGEENCQSDLLFTPPLLNNAQFYICQPFLSMVIFWP